MVDKKFTVLDSWLEFEVSGTERIEGRDVVYNKVKKRTKDLDFAVRLLDQLDQYEKVGKGNAHLKIIECFKIEESELTLERVVFEETWQSVDARPLERKSKALKERLEALVPKRIELEAQNEQVRSDLTHLYLTRTPVQTILEKYNLKFPEVLLKDENENEDEE